MKVYCRRLDCLNNKRGDCLAHAIQIDKTSKCKDYISSQDGIKSVSKPLVKRGGRLLSKTVEVIK